MNFDSYKAVAHSLTFAFHPLLNEKLQVKAGYYKELTEIVYNLHLPMDYAEKYLECYSLVLGIKNMNFKKEFTLSAKLKSFIFFDVLAIFAYDSRFINLYTFNNIKNHMIISGGNFPNFQKIQKLYQNNITEEAWDSVIYDFQEYSKWLSALCCNQMFSKEPLRKILITASMSAGKSSFVNALCGANIAKTQNIACTGRLHYIYSKPFDDGLICKWEHLHELKFNAKNSIIVENEAELQEDSFESVCFKGELAGERLMLIDTPGINSSENPMHKEITEKAIVSADFNRLIYIINAQSIGTDDDEKHLKFICKNVNSKKVIFILNKLDTYGSDDDVFKAIENTHNMLCHIGFKNPLICPFSAQAANVAKNLVYGKQNLNELKRYERDSIYNLMDKFNSQEYDLSHYYEKNFNIYIAEQTSEEGELLRKSGIMYIEKIIESI